ncbi:13486_t:CDS:1, partial [Funneliformis geosporum]
MHSTSQVILHSHLVYNLTNLHHRFIAAHSESLLFTINDDNLLGISIKHRLKQLQQKEWLANSPLVYWLYNTPSKDSDWVVNVLYEWNKSEITVQIPINAYNLIKGGNTPLHTLIPKRYKEFAFDLRKYSLLFIKQLSYSYGRSLLTFADLSVYQNTPHIGQISTWFTKLQELFSNPNSCELRQ